MKTRAPNCRRSVAVMSKTIRFEWRASAPGEGEPQVLFVQDGNILYPAFWTPGRRELDAWQKRGLYRRHGRNCLTRGLRNPGILAGAGKRMDFHAARWLRVWAAIGRQLLQAKGVARAACARGRRRCPRRNWRSWPAWRRRVCCKAPIRSTPINRRRVRANLFSHGAENWPVEHPCARPCGGRKLSAQR